MEHEVEAVLSTPVGKKTMAKTSGTPAKPSTSSQPIPGAAADSDDEGDEEIVDLRAMQAFAR
jgi:hypothetical protein